MGPYPPHAEEPKLMGMSTVVMCSYSIYLQPMFIYSILTSLTISSIITNPAFRSVLTFCSLCTVLSLSHSPLTTNAFPYPLLIIFNSLILLLSSGPLLRICTGGGQEEFDRCLDAALLKVLKS